MYSLAGKKIILGITGGIAVYKAANILRRLTSDFQADVQVIMTRHALEFMTPLVFETFSGKVVLSDMFSNKQLGGTHHIDLIRNADLVLVAPATANIVGKVAGGIADDLLSTMLMVSQPEKTFFALAMNSNMYLNPFFQKNKKSLLEAGYRIIEPETGELATRHEGYGIGRLAEESSIVQTVVNELSEKPLAGKKIVITAGPTREYIDAVRFISNPSTGKMGFALAEAAQKRGADVILIAGPNQLKQPYGVQYIAVVSADEMFDSVAEYFSSSDVLIMAAAVEDIRPHHSEDGKIKKSKLPESISIEKNRDILNEMGQRKKGQLLVGFSVEITDKLNHSIEKLQRKNLDYIVVNNPTEAGAGFAVDTNKVTLINKNGTLTEIPLEEKSRVADELIIRIFDLDQ